MRERDLHFLHSAVISCALAAAHRHVTKGMDSLPLPPSLLKGAVISALEDADVRHALQSSIDVRALLADPAVQTTLASSIDISSVLCEPAVQRELLRALDVSSMLSDPSIQQTLLSNLDLPGLLNDPSVTTKLLSGLDVRARVVEVLARDGAVREGSHAALVSTLAAASIVIGSYTWVLSICTLTALTFGLYLTAFITTAVFQLVWLHIVHVPRAILSILAMRRVPRLHQLYDQAIAIAAGASLPSSTLPSFPVPSGGPSPSTPPSSTPQTLGEDEATPASELKKSLMGILSSPLWVPFAACYACCLLTDAIALICVIVLCHTASPLEQAALAVLAALTIGLTLLDVAPALLWPLLRWALPASSLKVVDETVSAACASLRAKFNSSSPAASVQDAAGATPDHLAQAGAHAKAPPRESMHAPFLASNASAAASTVSHLAADGHTVNEAHP